jgi:molybdate/tungstate transport system permease protein
LIDFFSILLLALSSALIIYILLPIFSAGLRFDVLEKNLLTTLSNREFSSSLLLSIGTSSISTIICIITGIPLAYLISRTNSRLSHVLRIIIALPLAIPPFISGALLLNIYGNSSLLGMLAQTAGLSLTQSSLGIILAQVFVISPFVVLTSISGFENVDRNYEHTSRILGKSAAFTFFAITSPLVSREIATGAVLAWIRALGDFGANVMMAYNPKTISIQLWEYNAMGGLGLVIPGVVIVLFLSFLSLGIFFLVSFTNLKKGKKSGGNRFV